MPTSAEREHIARRALQHGATLRDVVEASHLDLRLLSGHDRVGSTAVLGAHAIEIAQPTVWTPPGWIVLTTGLRLHDDPGAQRELVRELAEHDMAALGFSVGVGTQSVPADLLEVAVQLNFPVFEIPLETRTIDVINHVRRLTLRDDPELLQQVVDTHAYLIGGGDESDARIDEPVDHAILRRLSPLVDSELSLVDVSGTAVWPEVSTLSRAVVRTLDHAAGDDIITIPTAKGQLLAFPAAYGRRRYAWVIVRSDDALDPSDLPLIRAATGLIAFAHGTQGKNPANVSSLQHELFVRFLQGESATSDLRERAGLLGFVDGDECRVVLLEQGAPDVTPGLGRALTYFRIPWLVHAGEGFTALFIQTSTDTLTDLLGSNTAGGVSVGRPVHRLADLRISHESAQFVARYFRSSDRVPPQIAWWDSLPVSAWMLSSARSQERRQRAEEFLAPLVDQPLLVEALVAYFTADQEISAAAQALFLHPNSLRYRLSRAEQALGGSLRKPSLMADLYAALVETGLLAP